MQQYLIWLLALPILVSAQSGLGSCSGINHVFTITGDTPGLLFQNVAVCVAPSDGTFNSLPTAAGIIQITFPAYFAGTDTSYFYFNAGTAPFSTGVDITMLGQTLSIIGSCHTSIKTLQFPYSGQSFSLPCTTGSCDISFTLTGSFNYPPQIDSTSGFEVSILDAAGSTVLYSTGTVSVFSPDSSLQFATISAPWWGDMNFSQMGGSTISPAQSSYLYFAWKTAHFCTQFIGQNNCQIQIEFPTGLTVDGSTTIQTATGIFAGYTGLAVSGNIVTFNACGTNYGNVESFTNIFYVYGVVAACALPTTQPVVTLNIYTMDQLTVPLCTYTSMTVNVTVGAVTISAWIPGSTNITALTTQSVSMKYKDSLAYNQMWQIILPSAYFYPFPSDTCDGVSQATLFNNLPLSCSVSSYTMTIMSPQLLSNPDYSNTVFTINLGTFRNPFVNALATGITIENYSQVTDGSYCIVNSGTYSYYQISNSFLIIFVVAQSTVNLASAVTYTFTMYIQTTIPLPGQLQIQFQSDIGLTSATCSSCAITQSNQTVAFNGLDFTTQLNNPFTIVLNNVVNPSYMGSFQMYAFTYGSSKKEKTTGNLYLTTTEAYTFTSITITNTNNYNGQISPYTVSLVSPGTFQTGNLIIVTFDITNLPLTAFTGCSVATGGNLASVTCTVINTNQVSAQITVSATQPCNSIAFTINSVTNFATNEPQYIPFVQQYFQTGTTDLMAQGTASSNQTLVTPPQLGTPLMQLSMNQTSELIHVYSNYTLTFQLTSTIPSGGSMSITIPTTQLDVSDLTVFDLYLDGALSASTTYSYSSGVFTVSLPTPVPAQTNMMLGMGPVNSTANTPQPLVNQTTGSGIQIQTFDSLGYIVDDTSSANEATYPLIICSSSCNTCPLGQPSYCESCVQDDANINAIYFYAHSCLASCPWGFFPDPWNNCVRCDIQCGACQGTADYCLTCNHVGYPYMYENYCYEICPNTTYTNSDGTCIDCALPCVTCLSASLCLTCESGNSMTVNNLLECLPCPAKQFLYGVSCTAKCPAGYEGDELTWLCVMGELTGSGSRPTGAGSADLNQNVESSDLISASIISVSSSGVCTIQFNSDLMDISNIHEIGESDLSLIHISPSNEKQNLQFHMLSFIGSTLSLQIEFEDPSDISQMQAKDQLQVEFVSNEYFISPLTMLGIQVGFRTNQYQLPVQLDSNDTSLEAFESLTEGSESVTKVITLSNVALQAITMSSMSFLYGIINSNQIVGLLPLFSFNYPYIVTTYLALVRQFSTFQLLKLDDNFSQYGHLIRHNAYNENFEHLGYETISLVMNSDSNIGILCVSVVPLTATLLLRHNTHRHKFLKRAYQYLAPMFLYNYYIRTLMEANLEFFMFSLMNILYISTYTPAAYISTALSFVCIVLYPASMIFVPIFLWKKGKSILRQKHYKETIGTLWEEYDLKPAAYLHMGIVIMRRLVFACLAIFWQEYIVQALSLIVLMTLLNIVYLMKEQPYESAFLNRQNIINEIVSLIIYNMTYLFTDYVPDIMVRHYLGFLLIGINFSNMIGNFLIILWHLLVHVIQAVKRWFSVFKKIQNKAKKDLIQQIDKDQKEQANQQKPKDDQLDRTQIQIKEIQYESHDFTDGKMDHYTNQLYSLSSIQSKIYIDQSHSSFNSFAKAERSPPIQSSRRFQHNDNDDQLIHLSTENQLPNILIDAEWMGDVDQLRVEEQEDEKLCSDMASKYNSPMHRHVDGLMVEARVTPLLRLSTLDHHQAEKPFEKQSSRLL